MAKCKEDFNRVGKKQTPPEFKTAFYHKDIWD